MVKGTTLGKLSALTASALLGIGIGVLALQAPWPKAWRFEPPGEESVVLPKVVRGSLFFRADRIGDGEGPQIFVYRFWDGRLAVADPTSLRDTLLADEQPVQFSSPSGRMTANLFPEERKIIIQKQSRDGASADSEVLGIRAAEAVFSPDEAYLAIREVRSPSRKGDYSVLTLLDLRDGGTAELFSFYPFEEDSVELLDWKY